MISNILIIGLFVSYIQFSPHNAWCVYSAISHSLLPDPVQIPKTTEHGA